ncbi:MAG: hypothetical protein RIB86_18320, partial [Imperialibacter sp.]
LKVPGGTDTIPNGIVISQPSRSGTPTSSPLSFHNRVGYLALAVVGMTTEESLWVFLTGKVGR